MRLIPISKELRDYIERLHFEEARYRDLLNTVTRENCPMTDEEWDSSYEYYTDLYEEASFCKRIALDEIKKIYQKEI